MNTTDRANRTLNAANTYLEDPSSSTLEDLLHECRELLEEHTPARLPYKWPSGVTAPGMK